MTVTAPRDLTFAPAHELADAVRAARLRATDLLEHCLGRIERFDPDLRSFTTLCADRAREAARAIDARVARGEDPGPLAGLPLGVKDLEDVAGLPTSHGSVPFRDHVAEQDSVQVARLVAAGAVVVGKTNTPEFGSTAFTKNRLFGTCRNPWNLERTPGGSSGGSAAAVAAGLVPIATGSDGGGSIRIPACYTGLYGLKATFGRIPRGPEPNLPWIDTVSVGPMVRTVRDAARYLDVVCGYDPVDPNSVPHPGVRYEELLTQPLPRLKIAYSATLGFAQVAHDVAREVEKAREAFVELGHEVVEIEDVLPDLGLQWGILSSAEICGVLGDRFDAHRDAWGRGFAKGVELGRAMCTPAFIGEAQRLRRQLVTAVEAIFARFDLLLTPTLPTEAFAAAGPMPEEIDGVALASPMHAVAFTFPFNLTGHPAASVRAGFGAVGLPVGLQIVGPRYRDDLVLRASYAFEQVRPWNDRWPELG